MKKGIFFKIYYLLFFIVTVINMIFLFLDIFTLSMSSLPNGELQFTVSSPSTNKTAEIYKIDEFYSQAIRVALVTDDKKESIYWQTSEKSAEVYWYDDNIVVINGISIDTSKNESYDSRRNNSLLTNTPYSRNLS